MPDYMYQLESRLSTEQRAGMIRIQELAAAAESNVYLVGGAVRDLISGMPIRDLDFTVEGNPARIIKELQKSGTVVVSENDSLRSYELILPGEVDASISAAREEVYSRPGAKFEARFSTIMEDLRRRDFSINAIAISLNANSRGLLLDPTNGLADLERREIRSLSIHSFTNQPVRLLRALRYAARMDFKLDSRTGEWFKLAMERELPATISAEDAGRELRQVVREEKPGAILKAWESEGLMDVLHPQLGKRHPDYEAINRVTKVRDEMVSSGLRPRLFAPVAAAILGKLKDKELSAVLSRMAMRTEELKSVQDLESEAAKMAKVLTGPKTTSVRETYDFLESAPLDLQAYILAESSNAKAVSKIKTYMTKWKPLRQALPGVATELETLGLEHGPKFDKVLEDFFQAQMMGRAKKPEDQTKILRKLAGIKDLPKKVEEKKKPEKGKKKGDGVAPPTAPVVAEAPKARVSTHGAAGSVSGRSHGLKSSPAHAAPKATSKETHKAKPKGRKK